MEYNVFEKILLKKAEEIQIELSDDQVKNFYKYMQLLVEWNGKINLTAITEPEDIVTKHFIDSLTVQKYIRENESVIDIGTGAGFPGIPLKILRKNIIITLLDSLNKRITFLEEVIGQMDLNGIRGIHGRAEELGRDINYREKYDIAVSRAVASLNSLLEYMSPFVKVGGKLICMKGPKLEKELKEAGNAVELLGLEIERIERVSLPDTDVERNILIVKKVKNISKEYPRKMTNIKKRPI